MKKIITRCVKSIRYRIRLVYQVVYYCAWGWFTYGRISPTCFISPKAKVLSYADVLVSSGFMLRANCLLAGSLVAGRHVRFGEGCCIYGNVTIGSHVMVSSNVVLAGGTHGIETGDVPMIFQPCPETDPICIGSDVWIGANAVILKGVSIGNGAIVGAGAVVTTDILDNQIVVGNPARVIKSR